MSFTPTEVYDLRIDSINADATRGGWEVRATAMSDTDMLVVNQNLTVNLKGYFSTNTLEAAWREAFNGYVVPTQYTWDRAGSEATFVAQTSDGFLRFGWLQGIGFRDTDVNPRDHYHEFDSVTGAPVERMTMGRIVRHILGYYDDLGNPPATNPDWVAHCNLVYHMTENPHGWINLDQVTMAPFDALLNPNGSMRVDRYIVRETKNLWSTLQSIAANEFFVIYFGKDDTLYYRRHPMFNTVPVASVMTFDQDFVVGKPIVDVRTMQVYQAKLHAVRDNGTTLHSTYPASPVHIYGNVHEQSYIRCNDQDTLDWWAEVMYGYQNRPYTVRWTAPGLCGLLFEIHDPVYITYTGTAANGVHIDWTDQKFWITGINVDPDENFGGQSTFTLEADYGMAP